MVQQAKYLGIIFDNKVNFKANIEQRLLQKCLKYLKLLKIISKMNWVADCKVMLRIYRSHIRTKLDYGSSIYSATRKSYLKKLQPIHNQGIDTSEKIQPTTSSAKNRFKELREKYSDHTAFHSDRSKNVDRTGAAVTNINNYKQIRLPNIASIYSAELQVIKMALDMIKKSEMGKSIIFSDSLSSLVAIQERNQNHPYIQEILETYHYPTNFG